MFLASKFLTSSPYLVRKINKGVKGWKMLENLVIDIFSLIDERIPKDKDLFKWLNEDEGVYLMGDISTLGDITPQNVRVFPMALEMGHHETMNLRYHWDDDFAKDNTSDESLQL